MTNSNNTSTEQEFNFIHLFNGKHDQYCIERPEGWEDRDARQFRIMINEAVNNYPTLKAENERLREALEKADDILDGMNKPSYMESFDRKQIKEALTNK